MVPPEMWDMMEKMIRSTNKKSKVWNTWTIYTYAQICTNVKLINTVKNTITKSKHFRNFADIIAKYVVVMHLFKVKKKLERNLISPARWHK